MLFGGNGLDVLADDADALHVLTALRNDDVGILLGGFDELLVHGFQHREIAVEHHVDRTTAFHHVAQDVADESFIGVGVYKNLQVHHVAQLAVHQRHDALDDNHRFGFHVDGLFLAVALYVAVGGLFDGLPTFQLRNLLVQQLPVESVGMVEVDLAALFGRHARGVVVIRVEWNHGHTMGRQRLDDFPDNGCFSGARSSSNSNDGHFLIGC